MQHYPKVFLGINAYGGENGNRASYLDVFLSSIKKYTNYPNLEIDVYDDFSPTSHIHDVCLKYNVRCSISRFNRHKWHKVRNAVFEMALMSKADYYMTFDDDYIVIRENWIHHIVACMEAIPSIGILGCHWACLEDGKTRQAHHAPTGKLRSSDGQFVVNTNKFVTGGCWTIRPAVIEAIGLMPEDLDYYGKDPGPDTVYCDMMLKQTPYELCNTEYDLAWHTGQEFMKNKAAINRYKK